MKSRVLKAVYQTAKDLHKAKVMPAATLRKFKKLCFSSSNELKPEKPNNYKDEENGSNPV